MLWNSSVYGHALHTLPSDDEFRTGGGLYNGDPPVTAAATGCFDLAWSDHFYSRHASQFTDYECRGLGEGGVATSAWARHMTVV